MNELVQYLILYPHLIHFRPETDKVTLLVSNTFKRNSFLSKMSLKNRLRRKTTFY